MTALSQDSLISCSGLRPSCRDADYAGPSMDFTLARTQSGRGRLVNIIGPEYEEKSCWLKTMCGLEHQLDGEVKLLGIDTRQLSADEWAMIRMKIAYLHADTALLSAANGLMNVLAPALYHRIDQLESKRLLAERALDLLEEIDPDIDLDVLPAYISREQRFKIAIARALLLEPDVLVLDNPFIHFDRHSRRQLQAYLNGRIDAGISVLLVTTDIRYALDHSDTIIYLDKENLCTFDTVTELRRSTIENVSRYMQQYPPTEAMNP